MALPDPFLGRLCDHALDHIRRIKSGVSCECGLRNGLKVSWAL